ncbi:hypothetical protein PtA15_1A682 [Puccinia triticina]|uniref:Uncharacterized protein n=1 Tax=Puccinia triticina TaxID=208348 RepID=A0ABY7CET5_9BASI|nr:uncharacterized protein PtA15_1A682 [Puccinia triticina]WAQ81342.1 hypothetical protein PtA15_1A682 [Puccinia triticina]
MDVDSSTSTNTADLEEPNLEQSEGEQLEDTGGAQSKDEELDTSRGEQSQDSYSQHSGESEQSEESDKGQQSGESDQSLEMRFVTLFFAFLPHDSRLANGGNPLESGLLTELLPVKRRTPGDQPIVDNQPGLSARRRVKPGQVKNDLLLLPPSRRRSRLLRRFIRRYDYPERNPRRLYLLAVYHQLVAELGIIVVPEYLGKYRKANWTS